MGRRAKGTGYVEVIRAKGKPDVFRARARVAGKDVLGARRKRRAEAQADLENLSRPSLVQSDEPPPTPTLGDWIRSLLLGRFANGTRKLAVSTWETNETIWRVHIDPSRLGKMPIGEIGRRDIQEFVDTLACGAAYAHRIAAVLSVAFTEALTDELVEVSAYSRIKLPKIPRRVNTVLTPATFKSLNLDVRVRLEAMICVATHTGLRRQELCDLKWANLQGRELHITKSKTETGKAIIPLSADALDAILAQPRRGEHIFTTESGLAVDAHNLTRDYKVWREARGIDPRVRLHDLRGTYVTILIRSGVDIKTVQQLARHSDIRTTLAVYAQSSIEAQRKGIDRLESVLRGDSTLDSTLEMVVGTGFEPVTPTVSL